MTLRTLACYSGLTWTIHYSGQFARNLAFAFTDLFDSLSTIVGLAEASNLLDEKGEPFNIKRSLLTDVVSTTIAGLVGSSPVTAYIASAAYRNATAPALVIIDAFASLVLVLE
ncbi:solute carrier family 23 protein [Chitinophagaceae bacterium LB-8]|uniref:Solute carrier family 23 protein n=1 Tax=Paraflavisolibacter caeni TaxID=2982496 RepID=A0A9X3BG52_9BACT|nr:solute carrier family 23 protein [Paraflavisolibacter caeni]MCU7550329.1 solute carrier family 23 protein [Paraflavisolibacter caeni]